MPREILDVARPAKWIRIQKDFYFSLFLNNGKPQLHSRVEEDGRRSEDWTWFYEEVVQRGQKSWNQLLQGMIKLWNKS
jgi:hypothetical protein